MSLHLIESTKVSTAASRKRGGALTSIVVHAVLVIGVSTAATGAAVPDNPKIDQRVIYTAPPPPPLKTANTHDRTSGASARQVSSPLEQVFIPVPTFNVHIPTTIPDIDVSNSVDVKTFSTGRPSATGTGGSHCTESSNTCSSGVGTGGILNELQVDRPVTILSGYRTPRYPEALRSAGVEQALHVQFVVDTLGRIESGSLEFPEGSHASFVQAVRAALTTAKYRPAEAQGRRVRQRVAQAFVFSLSR